jgi:hypothetical protein
MIDAEIEILAGGPPDRALEALEADIWAGVTEHERLLKVSRRLLLVQVAVLAATLMGALLAGKLAGSAGNAGVDIFSPRMALSVSTLLTESKP